MTLKEQLLQIKQNSPSIISNKLLFEMVENIGSLDSELRDTLIYSLFSDWTTTGKLTVNQEQKVSSFLLDNSYLLQNIDNKNDKLSIFTRSFAALFLASLSYRHNNHSFLSQSQQRQIIEQSIDYIQNEHDFRGLTNDGWAHGIAHIADLLDEVVDFTTFTHNDSILVINAIKNILHNSFLFTADEPGRMVVPVLHLINKNIISDDELNNWITLLNDLKVDNFNAYSNVSLFMIKLQAHLLIAYPDSNKLVSLVNCTIKQNYQRFKYI
ncbi:DUF2785 domain-containing protein [Leuconostoc mesenteroides]|uniref:DUF2785 domain-containing protein n=1 Tax=Leuconostoc mesenteroides TaxID=1245 RepID=UPI0019B27422|nr:DUF2785 domain-containing protein [Leuconostoc mesenteroides]MBD9366259.1 DUF2785 domain-containing protein [Leuconostoc mesenteroides]UUE17664.1 DUF2785 domain-containing protein [Leuconostoc mesenteroides]